MVKTTQAGQRGWASRWISLLAWGSLGLAAGCSNTPVASTQKHDPLHGIMAPPGQPQPAGTPKADASTPLPPQANASGLAALPASMSSSNPATLAGTSWQGPLGRPTPIDDNKSFGPPFLPGQSTLGSKTQQVPGMPGYVPPNANPKVEAIPDVKPANPPVTPTASWEAPPGVPGRTQGTPVSKSVATIPAVNAESLARLLQDRGVVDQKQDVVPEGVRLTCYLSRGPEGGFRRLEVTAADYASAAQAILRELAAAP